MVAELGVSVAAYAAPLGGAGDGIGVDAEALASPASVLKVQVALTVERAIADGSLDGRQERVLTTRDRTPGPVGISLMRDDVRMSVRDLVTLMLTVSDNVATDHLIGLAGLDTVNEFTASLGLRHTLITSDLRTMLDSIAVEVGFDDYAALAAHDPVTDGAPTEEEVTARTARSLALDPERGSRTTPADMVRLLDVIWTNTAAPTAACAAVRQGIVNQLTRHRIASGFDRA